MARHREPRRRTSGAVLFLCVTSTWRLSVTKSDTRHMVTRLDDHQQWWLPTTFPNSLEQRWEPSTIKEGWTVDEVKGKRTSHCFPSGVWRSCLLVLTVSTRLSKDPSCPASFSQFQSFSRGLLSLYHFPFHFAFSAGFLIEIWSNFTGKDQFLFFSKGSSFWLSTIHFLSSFLRFFFFFGWSLLCEEKEYHI